MTDTRRATDDETQKQAWRTHSENWEPREPFKPESPAEKAGAEIRMLAQLLGSLRSCAAESYGNKKLRTLVHILHSGRDRLRREHAQGVTELWKLGLSKTYVFDGVSYANAAAAALSLVDFWLKRIGSFADAWDEVRKWLCTVCTEVDIKKLTADVGFVLRQLGRKRGAVKQAAQSVTKREQLLSDFDNEVLGEYHRAKDPTISDREIARRMSVDRGKINRQVSR